MICSTNHSTTTVLCQENRLLTFNEAGDNAGKVVIVLLINISIVDSDTTHYGL